MPPVPQSIGREYTAFAERVSSMELLEQLASICELPLDRVRTHIDLAIGESGQTLRVLEGIQLSPDARVIEIGAGLGLTSAFLSGCGYEVTALEPGGTGFEDHAILAPRLAELLKSSHRTITVPAEELDPAVHGHFDLVFSNNVLEHVENLRQVLTALAKIVTDDGVSVHSCPNYSVPYEPHYGIPLVPGRPRATARLLPASIKDDDVWRSLNFVRARDITAMTRALGLSVHFRPAALANSLERLGSDATFRERHRLMGGVAVIAARLKVVPALRRLPATWSTPMDFLICRSDAQPAGLSSWLRASNEVD